MLAALEGFLRNPAPTEGMTGIAVQRKIKGVEIGVACWANGKGWVQPHNVFFENKPLMNDDVGPLTGEQGTVCLNSRNVKSRAWTETLGLAGKLIEKLQYVGQIAVGLMYDGERFWFIEWTTRQGYPSTYIEGGLINGTYADLFRRVLDGGALPLRTDEWAVGVVVSSMGYPFPESFEKRSKGVLVRFSDDPRVWPVGVIKEPDGEVIASWSIGLIACAVGTNKSLDEAIKSAYDAVRGITLPNKMFRSDIGARVRKQWPTIQKLL